MTGYNSEEEDAQADKLLKNQKEFHLYVTHLCKHLD